jgi:hypothetical protein
VANPLQGAAPHVVVQIPNADALLQLHQGDAGKLHLVHRYAEHLANALVLPGFLRLEGFGSWTGKKISATPA